MSENTGSAADAFDALREEVGRLRNGMELIYRQGQEIRTTSKPIDYKPTLDEMAKRLTGIEADIYNLKWELTPKVALPGEVSPDDVVAITKEARKATLELSEITGHAIKQQAVRWWLAAMAGVGIALGIALSIGTAAIFPRAAGAWVAWSIVGGDPWYAGQTLMRQADPISYNRMVQLYQACPPNASVALCQAAIDLKTAASPGR